MLERYKLSIDRSDGYLVWIEVYDDNGLHIRESVRRVLNHIREINDGSRVWGVVFGSSELKPLYPEIFGLGVETLYEVHSSKLSVFHPEAYASAMAQIIIRTEPAVVLFGKTVRSQELMGRVAAMLDAGAVSSVDDFTADGRDMTFIREIPGKGRCSITMEEYPQLASIKEDNLHEVPFSEGKGTVIYWQFDGCGLKDIEG